MCSELNIIVKNLSETQSFAKSFVKILSYPFFICLNGEIGAGKTTFAAMVINEFFKKKIKVLSPTFPIVQIYDFKKKKIWHYDLYRIESVNEFHNLDFNIAINDSVIVEWPKIFEDLFPKNRIEIFINDNFDDKRQIKIKLSGNYTKIKKKLWNLLKQK